MSVDIRTNFLGMQSGPVTLFAFIASIILFTSPVFTGAKSNSFLKVKSFLIFSTLGWVQYFDKIALTVSSVHFGSEGIS